jgi:hypothetical protein
MKNTTKIKFFFFLLVSLSLIPACKESAESSETFFNLRKITKMNPDISSVAGGEGFAQPVLKVTPSSENATVTIWETGDNGNWAEAKYLVFEVWDAEDYSGVINIEFYRKSESSSRKNIVPQSGEVTTNTKETPWLSCLMGILPHLKTKVVLPLSYLDAQSLFVSRSPRQLKGTMSGNRIDPNDIVKVALRFGPFADPWFTPDFEIASVGLTDTLPQPYPPLEDPVIDKFGQRTDKDWPGKIENEVDLVAQNLEHEILVTGSSYPGEWSKYGGWKDKRFKPTGFFRTQHDGIRWWLVDPEGYAFLSVGVDCIRLTSSGPVNGIEDLFEWLPGENDPVFSEALSVNRNMKNMDFYRSNLIRIYGDKWKEKWSMITARLMREYRVNTVGNWSDVAFARENRIPYVLPLNRFPTTRVQLYRDFPDVFSEEFLKISEEFARQLIDYKDDPYMVGYFLRNEPQWAFGYHNLAYEMFGTNQESVTKDEFIRWIGEKYNSNVEQFNKAWALNLQDFKSLRSMTFKEYPSEKADSDFYAFSTIMVKRYIDLPCDEVTKIDRNHLNLGMRYAWISSDLLYKAGERFDVFSINGYGYNPPATAEISKISGKPVMIGEFHHGAVDRALPATGITGVLNQEQRAAAYRNYIEQGFSRPELVGMHYFQWIDQPYYGRFDGENYNIGVVTLNNIPYPELTEAMKITNERIYKVGTGEAEPYKVDITRIPSIHY